MKNARMIVTMYGVLLGLYALYWGILYFFPTFHGTFLQGEDRGVEWLTFIGFMGAAATAWYTLRFRRTMTHKTMFFFFMLGLFFFICGGEEISWGQRILGFETPEAVAKVNEQNEFNIHNLHLEHVHPKDIVSWFMKLYGLIVPLVLLIFTRNIEHPVWKYVSSPLLIPAFLIPELIALMEDHADLFLTRHMRNLGLEPLSKQSEELMEMYWGLCILMAMILLVRRWRHYRSEQEPSAVDG